MWRGSWSELDDEICQDLPFDCGHWLEGDSEWSDLCDPLCNSVSLGVLHNGPHGVLCQYNNGEGLKVVFQLSGGDEKSEHQLLNPRLFRLSVDQSFANIVNWLLDTIIFPNQNCAYCNIEDC